MNYNGFSKTRKGKKRITTYVISERSKIVEHLRGQSDVWEPFERQETNRYAEARRIGQSLSSIHKS